MKLIHNNIYTKLCKLKLHRYPERVNNLDYCNWIIDLNKAFRKKIHIDDKRCLTIFEEKKLWDFLNCMLIDK